MNRISARKNVPCKVIETPHLGCRLSPAVSMLAICQREEVSIADYLVANDILAHAMLEFDISLSL